MNAYAGDAAAIVLVMWGIAAGIISGVFMFLGVSKGIDGNAKGDPAQALMGILFGLITALAVRPGFIIISFILIKIISELMMFAPQIP